MTGFIERVLSVQTLNNKRGCTQRVIVVNDVAQQFDDMPTPSADTLGLIVQYTGETTADFTHGYFYEGTSSTTSSSATATQTVGSGLTDIAVDVETLETFTGWTTDNSLQIFYTDDGWSVDTTSLGVTYTGTPSVGDAITISYTVGVTTYGWQQVDVQPSGSSDQHNLGWYATESALTTAHPTAEAGDWAIVGATDTVWIWDTDTSAWKDSDQKGQVVSVNSKTGTVVLNAKDVSAIPQVTSMPTVTEETIVQYVGTTNASYTNGYFYKATGTTTYTGTVSFDPASISGTTATCSGDDFAGLVAEYGTGNITDIIKGTLTYDLASDLLVFVGLDDTDTQVCTFQLYTQDYTDAGFVFTGTLADGDVIAFTTTISESTTYSWSRIDVQPAPDPLPSQTGNSGKFLTTDGTDASWSDKPLVNKSSYSTKVSTVVNMHGTAPTGFRNIIIGGDITYTSSAEGVVSFNSTYAAYEPVGSYGISITGLAMALRSCAIGAIAKAYTKDSIAIGTGASATGESAIAIGKNCATNANGAIQIGSSATLQTNSDANTFKVANNNGNFEIMSADGTIPKARLANVATVPSTTPSLAVADWSSNTQTITVTGVTASNVVLVSPAPSSASDYASAGIICTSQATDSLTFSCSTTPTNAIDLSVVIL